MFSLSRLTISASSTGQLPGSLCLCRQLCTSNVILINCHRASISRISSPTYTRVYPTVLALGDGSTINIRYEKPRKIIRLPLDLSTLSEDDRQARLLKRKPKSIVVLEEEIENSGVLDKYAHLWRK